MRGEDIMGKITGICISEKRGVQKHFIEEANIIADWGIEGDAHGGKWHRQISLLSQEKVDAFKAKGAGRHPFCYRRCCFRNDSDWKRMS